MEASRYAILMIFSASALLLLIYIFSNNSANGPTSIVVNNKAYAVTAYAYTPQQLDVGLMNATVTNRTFMLFYFGKPGIYPFWMKNTYSQIDIIWLNYSQSTGAAKVVYLVNATPCINYDNSQGNCIIYTPTGYSNYVLETKYGFVEENKIGIGTKIILLFR